MAKIIWYEKPLFYFTEETRTESVPICSECGALQYFNHHENGEIDPINYCYNCGARFENEME